MRRIINSKLYDTETATRIARRQYSRPGDYEYVSETLYQKETGELFLHGEGGTMSNYAEQLDNSSWSGGAAIIPEHDFDVKEWVSKYCDADTYIKLFGPVAE